MKGTETYVEYQLQTRKGDGGWNLHGGNPFRSLDKAQEQLAIRRAHTVEATARNPVNADIKHRIVTRTVTVTEWEPSD